MIRAGSDRALFRRRKRWSQRVVRDRARPNKNIWQPARLSDDANMPVPKPLSLEGPESKTWCKHFTCQPRLQLHVYPFALIWTKRGAIISQKVPGLNPGLEVFSRFFLPNTKHRLLKCLCRCWEIGRSHGAGQRHSSNTGRYTGNQCD